MNFLDVLLIGVALSMDACALTIANCTVYKNTLCKKTEWAMPLSFGFFQGIMCLIGFLLGAIVAKWLADISGYLVAGIFFVLAIKIVVDIIKDNGEQQIVCNKKAQTLTIATLLVQAIATSIDALLVGVTMSMGLSIHISIACVLIAIITFLLTAVALVLGKKLGEVLGKYAEWTGAIILFVIALKNLLTAIF